MTLTCLTIAALAVALVRPAAPAAEASDSISGAGPTLVAALVVEWAQAFQTFYGVTVSYNGSGSQTGINDVSSGAGDTYVFTQYLSRLSPDWSRRVGYGDTVDFPTGVVAMGNAGVTAQLESTRGAIAYVGASYLIAHKLPGAAIQNAAGNYEYPNLANIESAGRTVTAVPAGDALSIVDPPASARAAYPISTFSYVVASVASPRRSALGQWISYALGAGQLFGPGLDFAKLPPVVLQAGDAVARSF